MRHKKDRVRGGIAAAWTTAALIVGLTAGTAEARASTPSDLHLLWKRQDHARRIAQTKAEDKQAAAKGTQAKSVSGKTPASPVPLTPAQLTTRLAAIEKFVDENRQKLHIPGVALVIVKDDKVIYQKGLGLRDVERKLPVTPDTLFAIGSSSKAFTALTVLMSQDDGKLKLSDPPRKYLPYFQMRDPDADKQITISDLLCHRSGLNRTDMAWATGALTAEEIIQVACQAKPTAKFGEKFQYQNVMFLTAGTIAGKVQGKTWQQLVQERVFAPLGMTATETSVQTMQAATDHALGYNYDEAGQKTEHLPMRDLAAIAPAGAINSNARDMAKWVRFMLDGGVTPGGKRLVSTGGFAELTKTHMAIGGPVSYGYGWFLRDWHGHKVAEHGGNIDGFNAQVALMPDQHLGFALLTNVSASTLGYTTMETVWSEIVGAGADANKTSRQDGAKSETKVNAGPKIDLEEKSDPNAKKDEAPLTGPLAELVGTYENETPRIEMDIAQKEGKVSLVVAGQPPYPLEPKGKDEYTLSGTPPGFSITIKRDAAGKITGMLLKQPQGSIDLKRQAGFTADMTVDALMAKVIGAIGGEANLRKHKSLTITKTIVYDNQGVKGENVTYARAPYFAGEETTLMALGKKIGTIREYSNGTQAGTTSSFSPSSEKTGKALEEARAGSDFYSELNWKTQYPTVTIKRMAKVEGEDCYVVEKTSAKGSKTTEYISAKTFLVTKRDALVPTGMGDVSLPVSTLLKDYRAIDGVMIAFTSVSTIPEVGDIITTVKEVKFDAPIDDSVFAPPSKKAN